MRLFSIALLASAALGLAACDRGPKVDLTNASPADVAKAMKESGATRAMVRPGKWSSTMALLEVNSPGMPPEMQAMMKQRIGQPQTIEACLTAAEVDNPDRMLGQIPQSCKYDRYVMGGGKLEGHLRCDINGVKQEMIISGTYGKDTYGITIDNRTTAPPGAIAGGPAASMSMKMKVESKRLGECDGTEIKPGMPPGAPPVGSAPSPAAPPAPAPQGNIQ